jgi:hypothetical protein
MLSVQAWALGYSHVREARRRGARQQARYSRDAIYVATGSEIKRMRPLTALLGVVMGSAVALLAGLFMTLLVYLLLPEFHDRLSGEYRPLLLSIAWAALLTAVSATAFYSELRSSSWRLPARLGLLCVMGAVGWHYWPTL